MANLPKIALGAWAWGNDGTFGNDPKNPMPDGSARAETYNPVLDKLELLNTELKKVADKYGVGLAQIPVAWAIANGTLPIIGVTK